MRMLSIGLVLGLLVLVIAFGWITYKQAYNLVHHPKASRKAPSLLPSEYSLLGKEVQINNPQGQRLFGYIVNSNNGAYVMLQHGYKSDPSDLLEEAAMLVKAGYGVLFTSIRAHGKNDGDKIGFGKIELEDLQSWYDYLIEYNATPKKVGILGNSLGATMAIKYATRNSDISAVVSVSGVSSLQDTINVSVEYYTGLPAFPFAPAIAFWAERISGVKVEDINAVDAIRQLCNTPVLILQGGFDKVVSVESGQWLYEAACGPADLWFEPNVEHVKFDRSMPNEFSRKVVSFFDQHLLSSP